jgi:hypothetical protein
LGFPAEEITAETAEDIHLAFPSETMMLDGLSTIGKRPVSLRILRPLR